VLVWVQPAILCFRDYERMLATKSGVSLCFPAREWLFGESRAVARTALAWIWAAQVVGSRWLFMLSDVMCCNEPGEELVQGGAINGLAISELRGPPAVKGYTARFPH